MKCLLSLVFAVLSLYSIAASAEVTVDTYNGYEHTYSDPALREDADEGAQDVRNAEMNDDDGDGQLRQNAENSYESHSAVHR